MDRKSPNCLTKKDIEETAEAFEEFHERYSEYFRTTTRDTGETAKKYMHGQYLLEGKVLPTTIPKMVDGCNNQNLQHFITESPWDEKGVIKQIQYDTSELTGDEKEGALSVDGVAFPKQGNKSVGVSRQWCGRLGKVENCQVGVFLGYSDNHGNRILMGKRLYLPKEWAEDDKRREEAGVPEEIEFKTKPELGLDLIHEAVENNVPFGWINGDTAYGRSIKFRESLDGDDLTYMLDIPCDTLVWLPGWIDSSTGKPHRPPKRVDELKDELDSSQMVRVFIRDTYRGELWTNVSTLRVHPVKDNEPMEEEWLVIRDDENKDNKTRYQFSNASPNTSLKKLVNMSARRYWIERAIEDAKGEVGMADYEVRKWKGWHHHMTMSLLAILFLLEWKLEFGKKNA